MEIVIDFDGTCVSHEFPNVGKDIGAVPVLKELVEAGHKLILFTMRSDNQNTTGVSPEFPEVNQGNYLSEAVNWFKENDITLYGIQTNPLQSSWTTSPKAYGQLIIDDAALGCPLIYPSGYNKFNSNERPFVDWKMVRSYLVETGILGE